MSDVLSGQLSQPAPGQASTPTNPSAVAAQPVAPIPVIQPPAVSLAGHLAEIVIGLRMQGTVVGQTGSEQSVLRTDQGMFVITGRGPMPMNTRLNFQILATGDTLKAMILARNGQVLHPPMSLVLQPATVPAATQTPQQPVKVGTQFAAEVTAQPVRGAQLLAAPGTQLTARVVRIDTSPTATANQVAANQSVARPIPGGASIVQGVIIGRDPAGALMVRSDAGMVALKGAGEAALGTRVELELKLLPAPLPAAVLAGKGAASAAPATLSTGWPALTELSDFLHAHEPAAAREFVNNTVPRPNGGLLRSVMFLVSALRGGDIDTWLGNDTLQLLQQHGRSQLIERLRDDFTRFSGMMDETESSDWRVLTFPILDAGRWTFLNLFARRRSDDGQDGDEDETRFVLDFELSRMGDMQLDGLVKPGRFDLIVRSADALATEMRRDITGIFNQALDIGGYRGGIQFQAGTPFPVDPKQDLPDAFDDFGPVLA